MNTEREVLYAPDIMRALGIGQVKAYQLLKSEGFPSMRIGRKICVSRSRFERWLDNGGVIGSNTEV